MDFAAARRNMVDSQVRPNDVDDTRIQVVMGRVPREAYLPAEARPFAYVEREVEFAPGRRLLRAREFAKLIHEADIDEQDLVLDVGCGLGYSTAVLAGLAGMVVGLESDEGLAATAQETLAAQDVDNSVVVTGALVDGYAKQGPYDVIVVEAAIEIAPEKLLSQLKDGGRLACIERDGSAGRAMIYTRSGDAFGRRRAFDAQSASIAPGFERPKAFAF